MPQLVRTIKKLEDVAEPLRQFYTKNEEGEDGGFVLDIEGYEDPAALKKALKAERTAAKLAKKIKARFPEMDDDEIDVAIDEALKAAKAGAGKGGKADPDEVARLVEKQVAEKLKEVEPKLKERDAYRSELESERVDNALRRALTAAGVKPENMEQAIRLAKTDPDTKIVLGDNLKDIELRDKDGDPRGVTLDKWASTDFKKGNAFVFPGTGASGSGARESVRTTNADPSKMSAMDKINAGLEAKNK